MKNYIINEQSLKAIIDYLSTRPYAEVYQAIGALNLLPEVKENAPAAE